MDLLEEKTALSGYEFIQWIIDSEETHKAKKELFQKCNSLSKDNKYDLLAQTDTFIEHLKKDSKIVNKKEPQHLIKKILENPVKKIWLAEIFDKWLSRKNVLYPWFKDNNYGSEFHNLYPYLSLDELTALKITHFKEDHHKDIRSYKLKNLMIKKIMENYHNNICGLDLNLNPQTDEQFQKQTKETLQKIFYDFGLDNQSYSSNHNIDVIVSSKTNPLFEHTNHYSLTFLEILSTFIYQKNLEKHQESQKNYNKYDIEKWLKHDNLKALFCLIKESHISIKEILKSSILKNLNLNLEDTLLTFLDCYQKISFEDKKLLVDVYQKNSKAQAEFAKLDTFLIKKYDTEKYQHKVNNLLFNDYRQAHNFYSVDLLYSFIKKDDLNKIASNTFIFDFDRVIYEKATQDFTEQSLISIIQKTSKEEDKCATAKRFFKYYYLQFLALHCVDKAEYIQQQINTLQLNINLSAEEQKSLYRKIEHKNSLKDVFLNKVFLEHHLIDKKMFIDKFVFSYNGDSHFPEGGISDYVNKIEALEKQNIDYETEVFSRIGMFFKKYFKKELISSVKGKEILLNFLGKTDFLSSLIAQIPIQMQKSSKDSYFSRDFLYTSENLYSIAEHLNDTLNLQPNGGRKIYANFSNEQVKQIFQETINPMYCLNKLSMVDFLLQNIQKEQVVLLNPPDNNSNLADRIVKNCAFLINLSNEDISATGEEKRVIINRVQKKINEIKILSLHLLHQLKNLHVTPKNCILSDRFYDQIADLESGLASNPDIIFEQLTLGITKNSKETKKILL